MTFDPTPAGDASGRILLLAPHSDDIAYSLGATMMSPLWRGRTDLTILTLFTRSRHAPYLQTESEDEITRVRVQEDRRYAERLGARFVEGPFGEAMTRGYPDIRSIYLVRSPEDDPAFGDVATYLEPLLAPGGGYRFVVAPLAIGGHIEHDVVFRIVSTMARIPALFYEDQPYAADYSDFYLERFLERRLGSGRAGLVCASAGAVEEKVENLRIYASQFEPEDAAPLHWYASHRTPCERVRRLDGGAAARPAEVLWGSAGAVDALAVELQAGVERGNLAAVTG